MVLLSERGADRAREIAIDIATLVWLTIWITVGATVYGFLAGLAAVGRLVRDGGIELFGAGDRIGDALQGIPLVGEDAAGGVRGAFASAGAPLVEFGTDLERALIAMAAIIALLVAAVGIVPWLGRYLPWRIGRVRRLNAAVRVVRRRRAAEATPVSPAEVERLLASRALHRLDFDQLLRFSPDPIGDWATGRHDRLARAELEHSGLLAVGS